MNKVSFNLQGINLLKTQQESKVNQNQHNPFAANFKGELKADVFECSTTKDKAVENFVAKKLFEVKEFAHQQAQPLISFAATVRNKTVEGWNKLNSVTVSDAVSFVKEEFQMAGIDREVRGYMRMPVNELKTKLQKELTA